MNTSSILSHSASLYRWAVLSLALFAFLMSALVSRTVFERVPHLEDEVAYLFQARIFARGDITIDSPVPRQPFWQPFVLDDPVTGQRFGKYTIGYPLVLAVGEAMGQAWIINAFFAMVSVVLVFRIGERTFNADVGLVASALVAFSPGALLLNATLMAHSVALTYALAFIWAFFNLIDTPNRWAWASIGGISLGLLLLTRPLTTVAIALPFVVWVGVRLLKALLAQGVRSAWQMGRAWIVLAVLTLAIGALSPLFNWVATGNPNTNLYTRVWAYDKVGFGECCGRTGHTLEKAFRHVRFDMSLASSDMFGWETGEITPAHTLHLQTRANYWLNTGVGVFLVIGGVWLALLWGVSWRGAIARLGVFTGWSAGVLLWSVLPVTVFDSTLIQNATFAWGWIGLGGVWLYGAIALVAWRKATTPHFRAVWLFLGVMLGIVLLQMTYWIGAQRYSTRYWYESLGMVAIFGAMVWVVWMRGFYMRLFTYGALAIALVFSLYDYSTPRIQALYGYNNTGSAFIEPVKARATTDKPILVLVEGDASGENRVMWIAYSALSVVTSPYLDSEIVVARDYLGDEVRQAILALFPDREVIIMRGKGDTLTFVEDALSSE